MTKGSRRHPRAVLAFECLEPRLPLAGNITAVVSGSNLKITGDVESNQVTIEADPADNTRFSISSNTGTINTNINIGGLFTTPSGVKNIVINLLDGDDSVAFVNTPVPISVQGNVTINGGNGANQVVAADLTVLKNLTITNKTNDAGSDETFLTNLNVGGNVTVKNGNGDTDTEIFRDSAGNSTIGGNLSITNGVGEDFNFLIDTNVVRNVTVKNGKGDINGNAGRTQFFNDQNTAGRSVIGGNVSVSNTDGNGTPDGFGSEDGIWDYEVGKNATFNHGQGNIRTEFDGFSVNEPALIKGNLTIKGKGTKDIVVGQVFQQTGLIVEKNFSVTSGLGADSVSLDKLQVNGNVNLKLGDGANFVLIEAGGDSSAKSFSITGGKNDDIVQFNAPLVADKLSITLKNGTNTVNIDGADVGKATYKGGKEVDMLNIINGVIDDLTVSLLGGDDFISATDSVFQNSIKIDGGAGIDTLAEVNVTLPANPAKIKIKGIP